MTDRIVVMHDGLVEQIGTPLELYDHPSNLVVAQFIGSPAVNVFDGTLQRVGSSSSDNNDTVSALGARWPLAGLSGGQNGQKMHCGIRPGDLVQAESGIPAEAVVVEPTGAKTELLLQVGPLEGGGQQLILLIHGRTNAQPGQTEYLPVDSAKAHVFDSAKGLRLRACPPCPKPRCPT